MPCEASFEMPVRVELTVRTVGSGGSMRHQGQTTLICGDPAPTARGNERGGARVLAYDMFPVVTLKVLDLKLLKYSHVFSNET